MKNGKKLSVYEIAAYGIGGIAINMTALGDQFGLYYLTNVAMLPAGIVGTIMLLTTIFDAVNDPVIGGLEDQFNSRMGKYRPFMLFGGIFMAICMTLRFTSPNFGLTGKIIYFTLVLMGYSIGFTACCVPWQSMMSLLSKDYQERNILLTVRSISGAVMGAVLGAIVLPSVERFGGGAAGWQKFVMLICVISIFCILICQHGMKRVDYQGSIPTPPKQPLLRKMLSLAKNKPVVCVALAISLATAVQTLGSVCLMHYYEYILEDTSVLRVVSVWSLPIGIICPFLLPMILNKIEKKQLLLIGFAISMIRPCAIVLFGASLSIPAAVALILISRVGTSFFGSAIYAWIPECVDWTTWKEGASSAALISSTITFMQKVGRAAGQGLAGIFLEIAGFSAAAGITARASQEILRINGIYSVIGLVIAVIPIYLFPISKAKSKEIQDILLAREVEQNSSSDI